MNTAIATRDGEVILSSAEIDLVKKTVAAGASDEELKLFLHDCRRQSVHPLDKLIHFTKRGGRYTPITSIDFMRMRAADSGELAGNDDPVYTFAGDEDVIPKTATVTVFRLVQGQRCAFTATARWAEYKPPSGQDHMWMKMPQLMLGKCAEALALRKAFPKQLHGIYERAEMAQAGKEDDHTQAKPLSLATAADRDNRRPAITQPVAASDRVPESAVEVDEARNLFPTPEDDVERERIWSEIQQRSARIQETKTLKEQKQWKEDKENAWRSYCGLATPSTADLSALNDLLSWLKTREPK